MLGWRLTTEGRSYDYSKKKRKKKKVAVLLLVSPKNTVFWFYLISPYVSCNMVMMGLRLLLALVGIWCVFGFFLCFFYCVTHKKLGWKHSGAAQQRHRWIVRAHSIRCIDSTSEKRGPWARSYGMTAAREMRAIPRRRCLCRNME